MNSQVIGLVFRVFLHDSMLVSKGLNLGSQRANSVGLDAEKHENMIKHGSFNLEIKTNSFYAVTRGQLLCFSKHTAVRNRENMPFGTNLLRRKVILLSRSKRVIISHILKPEDHKSRTP